MRNAGEGRPSAGGANTGAGRRRAAGPASTARPGGNGGASLFTPAYRVRHAAPVPSAAGPDYDLGSGTSGAGYSWSAPEDQGATGYRQVSYDDRENAWADSDLPGGGYSWMTDDPSDGLNWPVAGFGGTHGTGNAIRGFPPLPDEPLPVYPPGPFAAWNRGNGDSGPHKESGSSRESGSHRETAGTSYADEGRAAGRSGRAAQSLTAATITPDEFDTDYSLPAIKDPVPVYPGDRAAADRSTGGRSSSPASAPSSTGSRSERHARSSGRSSRSGADRGKSRHQSVWLAIGAAVVIVGAVIAVLVTTSLGGRTTANGKPSSPPRSTKPSPTPPAGKWEYIGSRATDPMPLSLQELFPASFYYKTIYYHLTIQRRGHDCHTAIIGAALQAAVRKAGCTQDLRASYASRLQNAMATIGVFNLDDANSAALAAAHAGPEQFVAQLVAKNGVTSKLGQGTGLEEAVVKGHYLVLVWAEFINLASPKTHWQQAHLTNFMNILID
ncbi:MAG TPA: hypothetical protein VMA95_08240, partial [Streptosporangiaceae bacterium]|nr:hypothetical protein [Streptosporangiaceae bacterium]